MKISFENAFGLTSSHLSPHPDYGLLSEPLHGILDTINTHLTAQGESRLAVASGFRNFDRQLRIWNEKFDGKRPVFDKDGNPICMEALPEHQRVDAILNFSALPGLSRHHWGTDVDYFDRQNTPQDYQIKLIATEYNHQGYSAKLYQWLIEHAPQHQLTFPFMAQNCPFGSEPWHISHTPTAQQFLQCAYENQNKLRDLYTKHELRGHTVVNDRLDFFVEYCLGQHTWLNREGVMP